MARGSPPGAAFAAISHSVSPGRTVTCRSCGVPGAGRAAPADDTPATANAPPNRLPVSASTSTARPRRVSRTGLAAMMTSTRLPNTCSIERTSECLPHATDKVDPGPDTEREFFEQVFDMSGAQGYRPAMAKSTRGSSTHTPSRGDQAKAGKRAAPSRGGAEVKHFPD